MLVAGVESLLDERRRAAQRRDGVLEWKCVRELRRKSSAGAVAGEGGGDDEDAAGQRCQQRCRRQRGRCEGPGRHTAEKITQNAWVTADATSKVDVLQVALVINIGFAIANTAGNSAIGVSAPKLLSFRLLGLAFNLGSGLLQGQASVTTGGATGAGVVSTRAS